MGSSLGRIDHQSFSFLLTAICPVGNEVTPDGKSCMACQTGSYRKDKSKSHCIECPGQATTKQPGATSDSSCFGKYLH